MTTKDGQREETDTDRTTKMDLRQYLGTEFDLQIGERSWRENPRNELRYQNLLSDYALFEVLLFGVPEATKCQNILESEIKIKAKMLGNSLKRQSKRFNQNQNVGQLFKQRFDTNMSEQYTEGSEEQSVAMPQNGTDPSADP